MYDGSKQIFPCKRYLVDNCDDNQMDLLIGPQERKPQFSDTWGRSPHHTTPYIYCSQLDWCIVGRGFTTQFFSGYVTKHEISCQIAIKLARCISSYGGCCKVAVAPLNLGKITLHELTFPLKAWHHFVFAFAVFKTKY